ncbi:MAG: RNA-binding S4 domain-containing protein [Gammaproteobacteria bacterium]|nr:RNA-binding S4 domain-containing protein [Gammaproteobacteria bacterium]
MRIDKWLWFTRFYKTRGLAGRAVTGGHVRVNDVRAKASSRVSLGDRITLVRDQLQFNLQVEAIPARRGPAAEARRCYSENEASVTARQKMLAEISADRRSMPRTKGRPDKHTRRKLRQRSRQAE